MGLPMAINVPAARGFGDGFGTDLVLKNLGLALDSALVTGSPVPPVALVRNLTDIPRAESLAGARAPPAFPRARLCLGFTTGWSMS